MAYREAKMILLLSDARGIYIPRDFANEVKRETVVGVADEDWQILAEGPYHEWYWEAWEQVCNYAVITDPTDGTQYTVYQDGDCWLVEKGAEMNSDPTLAPDIDCMFVVEIPDSEESEFMNTPGWWSTSSGRIELEIFRSDALNCSQGGIDATTEVKALRREPYIAAQLDAINPTVLRDELREYGAWEDDKLDSHDTNLTRLLWIACGYVAEESKP